MAGRKRKRSCGGSSRRNPARTGRTQQPQNEEAQAVKARGQAGWRRVWGAVTVPPLT